MKKCDIEYRHAGFGPREELAGRVVGVSQPRDCRCRLLAGWVGRSAASEDLHVAADAVADLGQGLLQRLLDLVVVALPRSGDDHLPTLLGGKAQLAMTGTDAVLATAFATMLANQAGGLFVRQVAVGSPIGGDSITFRYTSSTRSILRTVGC